MTAGRITDVNGVLVGHATRTDGPTGCTVILLPDGSVAASFVIGASPASRELEVLNPTNRVQFADAFVLTGGSVFGLAAADGVVGELEARGRGHNTRMGPVPIVPTVGLFDLGVGDPSIRPRPEDGIAALRACAVEFAEGRVGAGAGASVAKVASPANYTRSGIGTASVTDGELVVGVLVANNAVGNVYSAEGAPLTQTEAAAPPDDPNTVLVAVASNAKLDKPSTFLVARMAAAGIAMAVRPAFTGYDGDVVLAASTGPVDADASRVGAMAAEAVATACRRCVTESV